MSKTELTVGPKGADFCGTGNQAIQAAIDKAASQGGGHVLILPGTYRMDDSLHLRSNVHVQGSGRKTILWKAPEVRSALSADLGYGHFDVSLAQPDKFAVGMGMIIGDDRSGGFYHTQATLLWRQGDRFGIDRMLNHDYSRGANAFVISSFPPILGSTIENASVSNLSIDGNRAQNPTFLNGCRGGGVFLIQTRNVALRGLHVANMSADAISFQQTVDTLVENCVCEDNAGFGLHPGSGSVKPIMRKVTCRRNGSDGIFYCLRVSFSLCEGCTIEENGGYGISIGGRDTDHLIRKNTVRGNAKEGIYFRPSDRVMAGNRCHLESNRISSNCQSSGDAEIHLAAPLSDVHLLRNQIEPDAQRKPKVAGIRVMAGTEGVVIDGNRIGGDAERQVVIEGDKAAVRLGRPSSPLAVGPANASPTAARHLSGC
jgi:hypothetical protein